MDLREAAELLRPAFTCGKGMSSAEYQSAKTRQAMYAIVKAYLAEHPADDGEPVTEEWLLGVGFIQGKSKNSRLIFLDYFTIDDLLSGECSVCGWADHVTLRSTCKTRGDVRRLCTALCIPLKHQAKGAEK